METQPIDFSFISFVFFIVHFQIVRQNSQIGNKDTLVGFMSGTTYDSSPTLAATWNRMFQSAGG